MPPFVPGTVPGTNRVCPKNKRGEIGLPLCKIRGKPGFVPGFHRICPRDKPGEIPGANPGSSQDQPDKKVHVYVPFSCLNAPWVPKIAHKSLTPGHPTGRLPRSPAKNIYVYVPFLSWAFGPARRAKPELLETIINSRQDLSRNRVKKSRIRCRQQS